MLLQVYNSDNNPDSHCEPAEGEPGLLFHEFIFLLAMIALNAETLSPIPHIQIEKFLVEKLGFIPDNTPLQDRKYKTFDHYLEKAQLRAAGLRPDEQGSEADDLYSEEGEDEMDRFEIDEKQNQFKQFLEEKA